MPNYVSARRDNLEKIKPYNSTALMHLRIPFFPNTINNWNMLPNEIVRFPNVLTAIESVSTALTFDFVEYYVLNYVLLLCSAVS